MPDNTLSTDIHIDDTFSSTSVMSGGLAGEDGSELPKLEVEGSAVRKTDGCGRAFFGDVSLGQGSGRIAPDENVAGNARQGGAVELVLVAEVAGLGAADSKCASSEDAPGTGTSGTASAQWDHMMQLDFVSALYGRLACTCAPQVGILRRAFAFWKDNIACMYYNLVVE